MTVRFLHEVGKNDIDRAGGKGANLGELISSGFPIPPGFIVCADVYREIIARIDLTLPHEAIVSSLLTEALPGDLLEAIESAHQELQVKREDPIVYAVRSSATAEDLGDASFAGQHETYYYVMFPELMPMIRKCWASLWSEQACAYRETQGIEHSGVLMAVVVQEMIPSDISGVTFTANPVTSNSGEIVTDATWGMGAAIVDGRVTPDHYVVKRDDLSIVSQKIANKIYMVSTTRPEEEGRMMDVPQHLRQAACLSEEMISEVTNWAIKSEQHFGKPQDLEWAIHQNHYYMLQSRAITTLGDDDEDERPAKKLVLAKAFVENFTDPMLPLTRSLDINNDSYKGRPYQSIDGARVILPLKMTDEQAAELMSFELPEGFKLRINWPMVPISLLLMFISYALSGILQARSRAMPDDFMDSFHQFVAEVDADASLSPGRCMYKLFAGARTFAPIGHFVLLINIYSVARYFLLMGALNKLLGRWIPDIQRDAGSLMCSGSTGVLPIDMGKRIFKLSVTAKQHPEVVYILQSHRPDEMLKVLRSSERANDFVAEFDEFLKIHGHRALKEFELASERFEENPAPVLAMIKNYLGTNSNPDEMEQHATDNRVAVAVNIQAALGKLPLEKLIGWRWKLIEYLADRARYFVKLRENSRFYHIMAWYSARKKILKAEEQLLDRGKLKVRGDIFYLLWLEVRALLEEKMSWPDVEDRIRARRMQTIRWSKQSPIKMLNIETTATPPERLSENQLNGQGASPGTYEGIARVIMDPSVDAELHPGEILVAPYTDPAWTPLFLVARAAVVGVGSYLSHAGTIAREYGMPCVVNVTDCTSLIRTGDRLRVDGTAGIVDLLPKEAAA